MPKKLIYSLPHSEDFFLIDSDEIGEVMAYLQTYTKRKTVVFALNKAKPIELSYLDENFKINLLPLSNINFDLSKEEYEKKIIELQTAMVKTQTEKVVFSRVITHNKSINPIETLRKLRKNNPQAFCYLFLSDEESWIGATPEALVESQEDDYLTMSLAGTLLPHEPWTPKEYEEQAMVTHFITSALQQENISYVVSPIEEVSQGKFKHLRQLISIPKKEVTFNKLIDLLHPTPAVCGLPKENAEKLIAQFENHNRDFYTGYISIESAKTSVAYVNIRCAKIYNNGVQIFVGGGITQKSQALKEWEETQLKANILLQSLVEN